jgi:hypothetical protein
MYPPFTLTGILALDETVILLIRLLIIGFVGIFWIVAIPTVPRCSVILLLPLFTLIHRVLILRDQVGLLNREFKNSTIIKECSLTSMFVC